MLPFRRALGFEGPKKKIISGSSMISNRGEKIRGPDLSGDLSTIKSLKRRLGVGREEKEKKQFSIQSNTEANAHILFPLSFCY